MPKTKIIIVDCKSKLGNPYQRRMKVTRYSVEEIIELGRLRRTAARAKREAERARQEYEDALWLRNTETSRINDAIMEFLADKYNY